MNERLVESVAQTILAMNDEERRLLDRKLRSSGLPQLSQSDDTEKSLQIAELAQGIHDFEEMYNTPLSELPADRWATSQPEPAANGRSQKKVEEAQPKSGSLSEVFGDWPDIEKATADSPEPMSSFLQLTQSLESDSADSNGSLGYAAHHNTSL